MAALMTGHGNYSNALNMLNGTLKSHTPYSILFVETSDISDTVWNVLRFIHLFSTLLLCLDACLLLIIIYVFAEKVKPPAQCVASLAVALSLASD